VENSGGEVRLVKYRQCRDGASVDLVQLQGDGHNYPGEDYFRRRGAIFGRTSDWKANDAIWEFFSKHHSAQRCFTVRQGWSCYKKVQEVRWALQQGTIEHPERWQGLTGSSTTEEIQARLRQHVYGDCPPPCPTVEVGRAYNIFVDPGSAFLEMGGWFLGAQRYFERDRRNNDSTYVSVQDLAVWKGGPVPASWTLRPSHTLGSYHVILRDMPAYHMSGWYLSVSRYYLTDRRNSDSTWVSVQDPRTMKGAPAEWDILPVRAPSTFKLRLRHVEGFEFMENWYLGMGRTEADTRSDQSSFVLISDAEVEGSDASIVEWRFESKPEEAEELFHLGEHGLREKSFGTVRLGLVAGAALAAVATVALGALKMRLRSVGRPRGRTLHAEDSPSRGVRLLLESG